MKLVVGELSNYFWQTSMDLTVCGVYIQFLIGDTLILAHCSQVEPYFLWDQCCQLGVQRGALFLCLCWGSGWLLLPSGWPRTDISRPVSRGQCLQWRLLLHQHLLGLVRQRVWVAGWLLAGALYDWSHESLVAWFCLHQTQRMLQWWASSIDRPK